MSKKILIVGTSASSRGGVASVIKIHSRYFPDVKRIESTPAEGARVIKLGYFLVAVWKFLWAILFGSIAVVHIHSASYNSFWRKRVFFRLAKLFGKKVVFQIHGGEFHLFFDSVNDRQREKIRSVIERADVVVCLSREWSYYYDRKFFIRRLEILNNIVDYPILKVDKGDDIVRFVFLGHVYAGKGIWDICDVVRDNFTELDERVSISVGGSDLFGELGARVKLDGTGDVIKVCGWLEEKGKAELLSKSDVLLLPSYNEGLPVCILEALSYGLAIVATNVGGIPSVVDSSNGFLIEPGDQAALYLSMKSIIENPVKLISMSESSKKISKAFLPDQVRIDLKGIYDSLI